MIPPHDNYTRIYFFPHSLSSWTHKQTDLLSFFLSFFPPLRLLHRPFPIAPPNIHSLKHPDHKQPDRRPDPQSPQAQPRLLSKRQPQRHRHGEKIVHGQVGPAADSLAAETAQRGVGERAHAVEELKGGDDRDDGGDEANDVRVGGEGAGEQVAQQQEQDGVEHADAEEDGAVGAQHGACSVDLAGAD